MWHNNRPNVTKIDLFGADNGFVDIDQLPLTGEEKRVVERVQGMDRTLKEYLLSTHGGHDLVKVEDVPGYEDCCIDLRAGRVYDATGKGRSFYHNGYKGQYLKDNGRTYLHRLVAYQYTRVTNYELYRKTMACPRKYEVHHKDPSIRLLPHGNGITNVVLLEKGLHQRYTEITRKLRDMVKYDGEEIKLLKPCFYHLV